MSQGEDHVGRTLLEGRVVQIDDVQADPAYDQSGALEGRTMHVVDPKADPELARKDQIAIAPGKSIPPVLASSKT
jgi:hypothetical protein